MPTEWLCISYYFVIGLKREIQIKMEMTTVLPMETVDKIVIDLEQLNQDLNHLRTPTFIPESLC